MALDVVIGLAAQAKARVDAPVDGDLIAQALAQTSARVILPMLATVLALCSPRNLTVVLKLF